MTATQYDRSKEQILDIIAGMRRSGVSLLPTEKELVQQTGVGRNTVRSVIGDLEAAGEVQRIQGKGTFLVEKATEISFSNWVSSEMNDDRFFDAWFHRYMERYPRVQLQNVEIPYHRYPADILNRLVHRDAPDVVQITPFWLQSFQHLDVFAPLGSYVGGKLVKSQHETANELVRCGGEPCALNWNLCPLVLYSNKVVLEKAGLDPQATPETLEELAELSVKVSQEGRGNYFGFCLPLDTYAYTFLQMYPLLLSFGGGFADATGNIVIDSEQNLRALKWIRSFYPKGGATAVRSLDGGRILFATDRLAFLIDGPYGRGHYRHFSGRGREFDSHYGVSLIPTGPSGRSESVLLSHALAISRNSLNAELAFKFIEYLVTDVPNAEKYFDEFGMIPSMRDVLHRPFFFEDPFASVLIRQIETASAGPIAHPLFLRSLPFILQIMQRIIFGEADPRSELRYLREIIGMVGEGNSIGFP